MATITWPPGLPQKPLLGWSEKLPEATIRTDTDSGPAKLRRRFTAATRDVSLPMALTETEATILDDFYVDDAKMGSLRFDWTHPRTGVATEFRFREPPNLTEPANGLYNVTLALEIMP